VRETDLAVEVALEIPICSLWLNICEVLLDAQCRLAPASCALPASRRCSNPRQTRPPSLKLTLYSSRSSNTRLTSSCALFASSSAIIFSANPSTCFSTVSFSSVRACFLAVPVSGS